MPDSGKDRWNSLLETLGVPGSEPAPPAPSESPAQETAPAPAKQPISMLRPEKSKAAAKPKPAKPAVKTPSYWSRIAGALGLESAAEPETAAEPPPEAVREAPAAETTKPPFARHEEARPSRAPRQDESPRRGFDRPRREEHRSRTEREQPETTPQQSLSDVFGKKQPDVNVFDHGVRDEDGETRTDVAADLPRSKDDSGAVIDYDRPEGADLSFAPPAAGERGFGAEEGEERDGHRRRRRRGRGRGRGRGGEQPANSVERHESDIEPAGEDADFDIGRDEELEIDSELSDQPASRDRGARGADEPRVFGARDSGAGDYAPRGERPTRRRDERGEGGRDEERSGGRSRRVRSERGPSSERRPAGERGPSSERGPAAERGPSTERGPAGKRAEYPRSDERGDLRPPRKTRHAGKPVPETDDEPDEDLQAVGMDDDDSVDGGSPTHRKIPTWDEAVNLLIDANMAARANSPDRGDRGRGRGRGRGR
jgi:hypothetical protein